MNKDLVFADQEHGKYVGQERDKLGRALAHRQRRIEKRALHDQG